MGYVAPRRDHIVEDVARQRRERAFWLWVLVPLMFASLLMAFAMVVKGMALR